MVSEHYENLLAQYYSWMFGDYGARVEANRSFFSSNGITPRKSGSAVDLGAGSGFQSMALAQLGFKVTAVDLSRKLLDEPKGRRATLPISFIHDDLLNFAAHCPAPVELIVCMGDTLPHLESPEDVVLLFKKVSRALEDEGAFVLTFRDLTFELKGPDRFIPVRSDANTIFTCFLEYEPAHVRVHDLVYTRKNDAWELQKSSYLKLRLSFDWTVQKLKEAGFTIKSGSVDKGMITIIAGKKVS